MNVDKRHRPRESGDSVSDPQLKVCGLLCPVRHNDGVPLATLWLHGVYVVSKPDHPTRTVQSTHHGGTSGYRRSTKLGMGQRLHAAAQAWAQYWTTAVSTA